MKLDISKIKQVRLKDNQFFKEDSPKSQIYLHHTAGNGNAEGVSRYWNGNETRIGTAFVIGEDGLIVQCFSSKHWAWLAAFTAVQSKNAMVLVAQKATPST